VVAQALFNLVALEQTLNRYKMNLPLTAKRMTNKKGFCGQKMPKNALIIRFSFLIPAASPHSVYYLQLTPIKTTNHIEKKKLTQRNT
jgi:hypothetical protein